MALNQLGYKCYHMHELMKHEDSHIWCDILSQPKEQRNWNRDLFRARDYTATVDWPTTAIYEDLMRENPSAKVVLTIRDTPEKWFTSVNDSIFQLSETRHWWQSKLLALFSREKWCNYAVVGLIWDANGVFDGRFAEKERSIRIYNEHIESVKRVVPEEQLLVMHVKEGWEPLCRFLGKEVPKGVPFPRGNTTADKKQMLKSRRRIKHAVTAVTCLLSVAIVGGVYKYYKASDRRL